MKYKAMTCLLASGLIMLAVSISTPAQAAPKDRDQPHGQKDRHSEQRHVIERKSSGNGAKSSQQAAAIAKQRQQGKVLSVKRTNGFYQVKMLHEGKVRYINVAAD